MKTKFTINDEIFMDNGSIEDCFKYFESNYYASEGWILNKETQDVYMEFDRHIQLNEGDRVHIGEYYKVAWKCVYPLDDTIEYALEVE